MSFKSISCQDHIIAFIRNAIKNERLAHAYIFAGQEGVGKSSFAKELAKTIFCRQTDLEACDTCRICKRISTENFPDLFFIAPEKNHRVIKIEQLKFLQNILSVKPLESDRKIVVVQSADKMNEEASNCLLKTLEEPPSYAIIILIVTSLESLRETVKSRCQIIRFSPLQSDVVTDILVQNYQQEKTRAQRLAVMSNGSIERARHLSDSHALEKKHWLAKKLLKLEYNENLTFSKELLGEWNIQELEILEEKRTNTKELLFSFLMYYRDLLICKTGESESGLYYMDWKDAMISKSTLFSEKALFNIIREIKTAFENLDRNANISLLIENLITKILQIQFGRGNLSSLN